MRSGHRDRVRAWDPSPAGSALSCSGRGRVVNKRPASACQERMEQVGIRALADVELLTILLGPTAGMNATQDAAERLLEALPLATIAWASADELRLQPGIGPARAAAIAAAFELGRRGAWAPPKRGERILDPGRVYELMRPIAFAEREEFHVVLLDVRGRLIKTARIAEGSLTQCPVSPRDALREPVRLGAMASSSFTTTRAAGTRARALRTRT